MSKEEKCVESEDVIGFIFTHWDCPSCDYVNQEEGHKQSEAVDCEECGKRFYIT